MASLDLERWIDVVLDEDTVATPGVDSEVVTFPARDGYPLTGTLVKPVGAIKAAALLTSGTGIPRRFYRHFAAHLAERGVATLTFDYRGIGDSRSGPLRDLDATMQDWGRKDMAGAFDWLGRRFHRLPRYVVGHSVGGQLIGLMDNAAEISRVVSVASSFGYWGNLLAPYKYLVWSLWRGFVPATSRLLGYVPAKRLGLGEDLPAGVAREWARWGTRRDDFAEDLAVGNHFEAVKAPWMAVLATDDRIATGPNARPLHALYPNAPQHFEWLVPSEEGIERIGHLGFFARSSESLWPRVSDFLLQGRAVRPARGERRAA